MLGKSWMLFFFLRVIMVCFIWVLKFMKWLICFFLWGIWVVFIFVILMLNKSSIVVLIFGLVVLGCILKMYLLFLSCSVVFFVIIGLIIKFVKWCWLIILFIVNFLDFFEGSGGGYNGVCNENVVDIEVICL